MHEISNLTRQLEAAKKQFKVGIADRLKAARDNKGYTQERLSELVNLGRTTITNIETGKQSMTLLELVTICDALEVTTDYIVGRKA